MSSTKTSHCRLCARITSIEKLIDMQSDNTRRGEISKKLSRLNANTTNLFEGDSLPNTVCLICLDSLDRAYEFVVNIELAQHTLSSTYCGKVKMPIELSVSNNSDTHTDGDNDDTEEAPLTPNNPVKMETELSVSDNSYTHTDGDNDNTEEAPLTPNNPLKMETELSVSDNSYTHTDGDNDDTEEAPLTPNNPVKMETELSESDNSYTHTDGDNDNTKEAPLTPNNPVKMETELSVSANSNTHTDGDNDDTEEAPLTPNNPVKDKPLENNIVETPKKSVKKTSRQLPQLTWKDYKWTCAKCDHEFPTIDEIKTHSMLLHDCCNAFKCKECNRKFLRLDNFLIHVKRHKNDLKLSCYLCNSQFRNSHEANIHKNVHTSEHICAGCNTQFANIEDLTQHVILYYKNRDGNSLAVVETPDNLTCILCKKTFVTKGSLKGHLLVHVQKNPKERIHTCDRCGKGYLSKASLAAHQATHQEARPFKCEICKSDFKTALRLKLHMTLHSDDKPYACERCGCRFKKKCQLQRHSIIHTDSLPFTCPHCSKGFRFKQNLSSHLRQYTGAQPYSCDECDRNFTNWSNCNKHMKRKHGTSMVKRKVNWSSTKKTMPVTNDSNISKDK